ncbi:hypothetical protein LRP52_37110 [Photobacterium sp. ZSDE20]|uniref:Uncharacterized protein n=1 Tax=Photobacterium pectinilyticum TaxID=2906793 RepID=A0ABT1N929_9GAMM|nr:hypothetical protein [Photobacterium sp. ZSDE20]MCQ1060612.1 hypothetical protein [Photobacterium sp. ZSDE20]MDD1827807.1 hypothetical protein [Photobacterium sp. ZSDE20]
MQSSRHVTYIRNQSKNRFVPTAKAMKDLRSKFFKSQGCKNNMVEIDLEERIDHPSCENIRYVAAPLAQLRHLATSSDSKLAKRAQEEIERRDTLDGDVIPFGFVNYLSQKLASQYLSYQLAGGEKGIATFFNDMTRDIASEGKLLVKRYGIEWKFDCDGSVADTQGLSDSSLRLTVHAINRASKSNFDQYIGYMSDGGEKGYCEWLIDQGQTALTKGYGHSRYFKGSLYLYGPKNGHLHLINVRKANK